MKSFFLASLLLVAMGATSQRSLTVYIDRGAGKTEKDAVRDLAGVLQNAGLSISIDSVGKFDGKGIYATTRDRDYFRQSPASLAKMGDEGIYVKGTGNYIYLCSNSPLGLQAAIFTYLDKLGFRFYFPDEAWFIKPKDLQVFQQMELLQEPDYSFRSLFMGWGYGSDELKNKFLFWERANRMGGAKQVKAGHAYQRLLVEEKEVFEKHPEFLNKPLVNGKKQSRTVLNFAEPGLADLAHSWLAAQFDAFDRKGIYMPMLSLEAFDGPNFCSLPGCLKLGDNASDQIFYFVNQVAKKLKRSHPGKMIGVLAYNDHIDIPKYAMEDNIFVTLTSAYNPSAYTTDELITRWRTKVKEMGMYDYMSVFNGTNEMPGRGFAGNYKTVAGVIQKYHKMGVTAYQAETTYGWIPKGLSHYLSARLTWDAGTDVDAAVNEFFSNCFSQTRKFVEPVFMSWTEPFIFSENEMFQWFDALRSAFEQCNDPAELRRLHQVALYINYVRLFKAYDDTKNQPAQASKTSVELSAYMQAIQEEGVVASYAGLNTLTPKFGKENAFSNKNAQWRSYKVRYPNNKQEWISFIDNYTRGLKRIEKGAAYNTVPLIPAEEARSIKTDFKWKNPLQAMTFTVSLSAIVDTRDSDSLFVKIKGGRIKKAGQVGVEVYAWNNSMMPEGKPVKEFSFPADGQYKTASLSALPKGRYILKILDLSSSGAYIYFPYKLKYSVLASQTSQLKGGFYNHYYFYVPKGVTKFYIVKTHYFQLFDPKGVSKVYGTDAEKLIEVPVGNGQSGWWRVQMQLQQLYFVGIPPLVSRDPNSFFLPQ